MCHGFQEITWHTTFFNGHARKMKKKPYITKKICQPYLWISQRLLIYNTWPSARKTKDKCFLKTSIKFHCEEQKTKSSN